MGDPDINTVTATLFLTDGKNTYWRKTKNKHKNPSVFDKNGAGKTACANTEPEQGPAFTLHKNQLQNDQNHDRQTWDSETVKGKDREETWRHGQGLL